MKDLNKNYLLMLLMSLSVGLVGSYCYRPYVKSHHLHGNYVVDSIWSFTCVLITCSFIWMFKPYNSKEKNRLILLSAVFYSLVWQGVNGLLAHQLNWMNIIAVWPGALITYAIKERIDAGRLKAKI